MPAQRDDRVVVITGASSGVGRATALAFARRVGTVVIAARRLAALEEVATECRVAGAHAMVVQTDVTDEDAVRNLASLARAHRGVIDVWVNNAGVTLYAKLEDEAFAEHRQVIETNLYGAIFGARAVVPIFREQERGILINVGSVLSEVGQAFVPAYAISKFAVRGLSEALRVELADQRDIHVCTVLPYAIDTPHFQVAANRIGRQPRALPPMQSPEKVATAIVGLADRPRRQTHVPAIAQLGVLAHSLFPRTTERLLLAALRRWHISETPERQWSGNLFEPPPDPATVHGDRGPQIGTAAFIGWLGLELGKQQLAALTHSVRDLAARLRA